MGPGQIGMIVYLVFGLLVSAALHGRERTGHYSFPAAFVGTIIIALLLAWGGFWSVPQ